MADPVWSQSQQRVFEQVYKHVNDGLIGNIQAMREAPVWPGCERAAMHLIRQFSTSMAAVVASFALPADPPHSPPTTPVSASTPPAGPARNTLPAGART